MTVRARLSEMLAARQQRCLTDTDHALLQAVSGWHLPCAPRVLAGKDSLIPPLAWVIADARRQGKLTGDVTRGMFEIAVASLGRVENQALRLSDAQITNGRRHLQACAKGAGPLSVDRAAAAAS